MNALERVAAAEAIRTLKASYCRAVDLKDHELFRSLFAKDAVADYRGSAVDPITGAGFKPVGVEEPVRGRDNIAEGVAISTVGVVTVHHCATGVIVIESPDSARADWPMVDRLQFPPGAPFKEMTGYGFYHETYVREDGAWKIATLRMSRLRVDFTSA